MDTAKLTLDPAYVLGAIDPRIYGSFIEHLGRAVYGGIYEPGHPEADEQGFRKDVLALVKELNVPIVRYPGGNFVSGYNWEDGVGPVADRPARLELAWGVTEPNTFGTDEFAEWAKAANTEVMMAVNLGTRGAEEARNLLEYCNHPAGSYWSDLRIKNGHKDPYQIKTWCLGNEMDGPWQAGHVPAQVYAQRADQAALMMKGLDPSIETILCGSSHNNMRTYMEWDRQVLEYCWDKVEYISAHRYSNNYRGDSAWYLAEGIEIDRTLDDYTALLNYVRAVKKSSKRVYLSFDEWNVWYRAREGDDANGHWARAPHLLEEVYNLEDAVVVAQYLTSFLRHADTVKVACIAQIVNVIAPILTRPGGLLVQSIYHPFVLFSQHAIGNALTPVIQAPLYRAGERGEVPMLDAAASHDEASKTAAFFLVNRSQQEELLVTIDVADRPLVRVIGASVLGGGDVKQANTWDDPHRVVPVRGAATIDDRGALQIRIPAPGLAVVRAELA